MKSPLRDILRLTGLLDVAIVAATTLVGMGVIKPEHQPTAENIIGLSLLGLYVIGMRLLQRHHELEAQREAKKQVEIAKQVEESSVPVVGTTGTLVPSVVEFTPQ